MMLRLEQADVKPCGQTPGEKKLDLASLYPGGRQDPVVRAPDWK